MQYTKEEFEVILKNHLMWLNDEYGGERADLSGSDLSVSNLSGSNLDFSMLHFSCKSLKAKFDNKHIIQILYHAAMPTQHNALDIDDDVKKLFNSDLFKQVVNKFHRVGECGTFTGVTEAKK